MLEFDVGARHAGSLHDAGCTFIPDSSEDVEADRGQIKLVPITLKTESVSGGVEFTKFFDIQGDTGLLFQDKERQPMVRSALLTECWKPGHSQLGLLISLTKG